MKPCMMPTNARPTATGGGRFRARISRLATGEIRLRMSPAATGSLDQERKLQEPYREDIERVVKSIPKVGHGSLGTNFQTGEVKRPKFSARAKTTLREFGAVLDERFGRNAVFFTLTLPASTDAAMRALAEQSSYVVARVTQWMRDRLKEAWYGWVWEFQKRGALHLHLVVGDDDYFGLVLLLVNWRDFAYDLLRQVETRSSCDLLTHNTPGGPSRKRDYVQMDAVFVQHSAARYLAKYMGKARPDGFKGEPYYPARWWRVSNKALAAIRAKREYIELRSDSTQTLGDAVQAVMARITAAGADVRKYLNAKFDWLENYIAFAGTADGARNMWEACLDALVDAPVVVLSGRDYGYRIAGGGGTSPARGAPAKTGLGRGGGVVSTALASFADTFTFMNSIRSTSPSTV